MIAALLVLIAVIFPGLVRGFFLLIGVMLLYGMLTGGAQAQTKPPCVGIQCPLSPLHAPPVAAQAQTIEVPLYPIQEWCDNSYRPKSVEQAQSKGTRDYLQILHNNCIDKAQEAYDWLKEMWPLVDDAARRRCIKPEPINAFAKYGLLQARISMEIDRITPTPPPKKFQR
jgi:hypothetical protein